jgi:hypothetical protein
MKEDLVMKSTGGELITSPPSVGRMSRKCGSPEVSQNCEPLWPIIWIVYFYTCINILKKKKNRDCALTSA